MALDVKPARPYICRLIIFVFVFTPSVRPLWKGRGDVPRGGMAGKGSDTPRRVGDDRVGSAGAVRERVFLDSAVRGDLADLSGANLHEP